MMKPVRILHLEDHANEPESAAQELRILMLEDVEEDAELIECELQKGGIRFVAKHIRTEKAFREELDQFYPTLILADFSLPSFDGLSALAIAKEKRPQTPFIFVSGAIGEESAIETLKNGATDYVLKQRLSRLVPSVKRAVHEKEERTQRLKGQEEILRLNVDLERRVAQRTDELEHSQAALRQAHKLQAIGQLAGGVAHDFNNLLQTIISVGDVVEKDLSPDDPHREDIGDILQMARRGALLTKQLLAMGGRQTIQPRPLNLNDIVSETENLLRRILGEDITILSELAPDLAFIHADPTQMHQVIMNLALNARDAMPKGGTLILKTSSTPLDELFLSKADLPMGLYVILSISDTGTGMTKEVQERIFEPFFTTKEQGKGTGLGLATVYGIAKQNNGGIIVCSHLALGTTFKVLFPALVNDFNKASKKDQPMKISTEETQSTGTILVVDDEAMIVKHLIRRLTKKGYTVFGASDGADALKLLNANPAIQLLISDVVMPGMNGRQLQEKAHKLRPDLKAIFMSGYPEELISEQGVMPHEITFLEKPFETSALYKMVAETLTSRA